MTAAHLPGGIPLPPALRGVTPLGVELGTVGGHRMVLLSLERWEGWADLRFARIDLGAPRPLPRRVPPAGAWKVTVDGTAVEVLDAVGRGDRSFSNGEVRLRPAPPEGAMIEVVVEIVAGEPALRAAFRLGARGAGPDEERGPRT